jgi:hypothetical protein
MRFALSICIWLTFLNVKGQIPSATTKQIRWLQVMEFSFASNNIQIAIQENERAIKNVYREIESLKTLDSDAKPKGPFETTDQYEERKRRFDQKVEQIKIDKLALLLRKQEEYKFVYVKQAPASLILDFKTENYNADKGEWKIKIAERATDVLTNMIIDIPPKQAEQLWYSKNSIQTYFVKRLTGESNSYYAIDIPASSRGEAFSILVKKSIEKVGEENAWQDDQEEDKVFTKVEIEAEFPGGSAGWTRFVTREIERNIDELQEEGKSGTVVILFIVDKDGKPSEVRALGCGEAGVANCLGPNTKLAEVAVAAIKKGPNWKPAVQNGRNVKAYRRQPVTFRLAEE